MSEQQIDLAKVISAFHATEQGRVALHGRRTAVTTTEEPRERVTTYADGFEFREALPPPPTAEQLAQREELMAEMRARHEAMMQARKIRTFSKFKFVAKLTELNLWSEVKAWIDRQGLTDLYLAASDFREDNPYFTQGLATLKEQLNLTQEQVDAILDACVADKR